MESTDSKLSQYLSPLSSIANIEVQRKLFGCSVAFLLDAANYDFQGQLSEIAGSSG